MHAVPKYGNTYFIWYEKNGDHISLIQATHHWLPVHFSILLLNIFMVGRLVMRVFFWRNLHKSSVPEWPRWLSQGWSGLNFCPGSRWHRISPSSTRANQSLFRRFHDLYLSTLQIHDFSGSTEILFGFCSVCGFISKTEQHLVVYLSLFCHSYDTVAFSHSSHSFSPLTWSQENNFSLSDTVCSAGENWDCYLLLLSEDNSYNFESFCCFY